MLSNSSAVQPKYPAETQAQFDELLEVLEIPSGLSAQEKLSRLRSTRPKDLIDATKKMDLHQFRPTTDGGFIIPGLFESLDTGDFAMKMLERKIRLIIGECKDERHLYSTWFPPKANTLSALRRRLVADYPERIVDKILPLYYPDNRLPSDYENWTPDAWGRVYANMQVYHMQRGLLHALTTNRKGVDASYLIYRYRIEFRAKCMDESLPIEWGVTHSSDYPLWFWGNGKVLTDKEKDIVNTAFTRPLGLFLKGGSTGNPGDFGWGANGTGTTRTLKQDGRVEIQEDEQWEEGVRIWRATRDVDHPKPNL